MAQPRASTPPTKDTDLKPLLSAPSASIPASKSPAKRTPTKRKRTGSSPPLAQASDPGVEGHGSPSSKCAGRFAELSFDGRESVTASADQVGSGERQSGGRGEINLGVNWQLDGAPPGPSVAPTAAPARPIPARPAPPPPSDGRSAITRPTYAAALSSTQPKPKSKRRSKSPPLSASPSTSISDTTWTDEEITGHLMQDPEDDGTGMNGIGFRPTAQEAQRREARRREQIERWKRSVAAEERKRRGERRKGDDAAAASRGSMTVVGGNDGAVGAQDSGESGCKARRIVRFAEVDGAS